MDKQILIADEVAELFRVDKQRVWELTRTNKLPGIIRLGDRQYRYSARAIQEFLNGSGTQKEDEHKDNE